MKYPQNKRKKWKSGNRAFYWTPESNNPKHIPLCLQSKEYNNGCKGVTWVYYSETDAKRLFQFLKGVFGD